MSESVKYLLSFGSFKYGCEEWRGTRGKGVFDSVSSAMCVFVT